jgi:hypothetical protein
MAFEHYPDGDFTVPLAGEAAFYCPRADIGALRRRAFEIPRKRFSPSCCRRYSKAARRRGRDWPLI